MSIKPNMYTSKKTGESKTIEEWAKSKNIKTSTLYSRLQKGMTIDEAIIEERIIKNAITESENIYGNSSQNPGEISVIREALRANRKL